ncbi:latent transforming growth factor beta-binding protein [Pyxidicoccus trucidator]|uniref:latent transforming growth factor beta-binding protein n=1 Tax=Pyxidicoccus trucidator TaxID=2709662 RepID=UPI0013DAAF25|nr:latent transforming growth factor beta-binding protein [Pyxidicoccus trucidator]
MRPHFLSFLAPLALLTVLGCPLDIQVRSEDAADAGCQGDTCVRACTGDFECPEGQRCDAFYEECESGPRLTQVCSGVASCPAFASCEDGRCELRCSYGCPPGYRCDPESVCVEECTAGQPETLGNFCESSLDCTRCGFCVDAGGAKKCHRPCTSDSDCPGGPSGACQPVPGGSLRVCRLS